MAFRRARSEERQKKRRAGFEQSGELLERLSKALWIGVNERIPRDDPSERRVIETELGEVA